jgi:hypothetical protein
MRLPLTIRLVTPSRLSHDPGEHAHRFRAPEFASGSEERKNRTSTGLVSYLISPPIAPLTGYADSQPISLVSAYRCMRTSTRIICYARTPTGLGQSERTANHCGLALYLSLLLGSDG